MNERERESKRVAEALRHAGVLVSSVYDLVNTSAPYPTAVPVLLDLLEDGITDDIITEGVVRALAVKEARGVANKPLIEEFKKTPNVKMSLKWAIGNTLEVIAVDADFDELAALVRDKSHGRSREMLAIALGRLNHPDVETVLLEALHDDDVIAHAIIGLARNKRSKKALEAITPLLDHPRPLVRKEAAKTIKRLRRLMAVK